MDNFKDNITVNLNKDVSIYKLVTGTPCLICGETVEINQHYQVPKICDKCKNAVMSVRRLLEYLEEEESHESRNG